MSLKDFLLLLKGCSNKNDLIDFCRKNILHGTPVIFADREDDFYEFRKRIADNFDIIFHEIFITGSGKLGFSPHKRKEFDYDSDIDVAIVSNTLFEQILEIIRQYQMELRRFRKSVTEQEIKMYHEFLEYVAIGWIRPDKLPISFQVNELKDNWFDFFQSISYDKSEVGNYKVTAGIFKSYSHLEEYTLSGLKELKKSITLGEKHV